MGFKIKLSNMILVTGFFIPIILFITVIFLLSEKETTEDMFKFKNVHEYILIQSGEIIKNAGSEVSSLDNVIKKIDFSNFKTLEFVGGWDITVKEAEEEVFISGNGELLDKVTVDQNGEMLTFKVNKLNQAVMVKANISIPELRGITTKGPANIQMIGIKASDEVMIKCEGIANIFSDSISIKSLILKSQGNISADLLNGNITELELEFQAVGSIDAFFTGGMLSGSMAGSGILNAYGEVLSNRIELKSEKVKVEIK